MSKVKMKCPQCGKHFKSSNPKQPLCPDCEVRERRARAASKAAGAQAARPVVASPPPKIVGPGAAILVPGHPSAAAAAAPVPAAGAGLAEQRPPTGRAPASATAPARADAPATKPARADRGAKAPAAPRPPREPRPQIPPFELTDELRARIEARYLELARPVEYDGIRTQVAKELTIPKHAVKRAVQELRQRMQLPSWWDLQSYSGTEEDLERIRAAYLPLLPVPEVGVHKALAVALDLEPRVVYQGIRRIRAEMRLPQYNPPEMHGGEAAQDAAGQAGEAPTGTGAAGGAAPGE